MKDKIRVVKRRNRFFSFWGRETNTGNYHARKNRFKRTGKKEKIDRLHREQGLRQGGLNLRVQIARCEIPRPGPGLHRIERGIIWHGLRCEHNELIWSSSGK